MNKTHSNPHLRIGDRVSGDLGRPDTDFVGIVVSQYKVSEGLLKGAAMIKVATTGGRTVSTFRGLVEILEPQDEFDAVVAVMEYHEGEILDAETPVDGKVPFRAVFRTVGHKVGFLVGMSRARCDVQITNHIGTNDIVLVLPS